MSTATQKRHTIFESEIATFQIEEQMAGSFGEGSDKELLVRVTVGPHGEASAVFIVKHKRSPHRLTLNLREAVEAYNELP